MAMPTGAMVGTGQGGHKHKGLGGRARGAAGAMVQQQSIWVAF